jgi:hypothetical protein
MFDPIIKILSSKESICGNLHLTQEEFLLIKGFFDDAIYLIYAQEKNQTQSAELKRNEPWQVVYAFAKESLISCNQMLKVSEQRTYEENQLKSRRVYIASADLLDILPQVSYRLNSIHGLSDGTELAVIMTKLRNRETQLGERIEEIKVQETPPEPERFYHINRNSS